MPAHSEPASVQVEEENLIFPRSAYALLILGGVAVGSGISTLTLLGAAFFTRIGGFWIAAAVVGCICIGSVSLLIRRGHQQDKEDEDFFD